MDALFEALSVVFQSFFTVVVMRSGGGALDVLPGGSVEGGFRGRSGDEGSVRMLPSLMGPVGGGGKSKDGVRKYVFLGFAMLVNAIERVSLKEVGGVG